MKKNLTLLFSFIFLTSVSKAQYVTIADTIFRNTLQYQYASCFNGAGQMDTTCTGIVNATSLNLSYDSVRDITEIKYFKSLDTLDCSYDYNLQQLPSLPKTLKSLNCFDAGNLTSLPFLPDSLVFLDCGGNPGITSLPELPNTLTGLACDGTGLSGLPTLPKSLRYLNVEGDETMRDLGGELPDSIIGITMYGCFDMECLPWLPASLKELDGLGDTRIACLPNFPNSLIANNPFLNQEYPLCSADNNPNKCPLFTVPVKLISFNAITQPNSNNTLLDWSTASELNTKSFVIEQSTDGINFTPLATILAKGSGSHSYSYNLSENAPVVYYRLKMIDNNGQYSYSSIINIKDQQSNEGIVLLNNPVKDWMNIKTSAAALNNSTARIISSQGTLVKSFVLQKGVQSINISELPSGAYYIQTQLASLKMIISR